MNEILQKRIEKVKKKKIIQEYVESFRYENGMELEPTIKIFLEKIGSVFFEHGISFALQNHVTEALKSSHPTTYISDHISTHNLFKETFKLS